jgi:hypothetical protein
VGQALFPAGQRDFSRLKYIDAGFEAYPANYTNVRRVKQQKLEANSRPSSAELKVAWSFVSVSPHGIVFDKVEG